jgi:voltage-gated sodium channel
MFEISPYMNHLILALRHVGLSILNVSFLMIISFYILGVIGVELFAEHFPKQFGNLPWSFFTLFRLMVYDDYGVITRPILEIYPYAWIYFLIITIILAFVLINFFVAVVVTALQRAIDTDKDPLLSKVKQEMKILETDENTIQSLRAEIQELKEMVRTLTRKSS